MGCWVEFAQVAFARVELIRVELIRVELTQRHSVASAVPRALATSMSLDEVVLSESRSVIVHSFVDLSRLHSRSLVHRLAAAS